MLTIELVPKTMWGKNVRAVVSKENWDLLRQQYGAYDPCKRKVECATCGSKEDVLDLHEEWNYDDSLLIQRLVGLVPICEKCHYVKHIGRARQLGKYSAAVSQLKKVNGWTESEADAYICSAFVTWEHRSKSKYEIDFGFLGNHLRESQIHKEWLDSPKRWTGNRTDVIFYARDLLKSSALILDTETTGLLDNKRSEIIEIGIVNMRGESVYEGRFKPTYSIPARTTEIHGIRDEDVINSPTLKASFPEISEVLSGKLVIAYNARFDSGMLSRACRKYRKPDIECQWECAMWLYRYYQECGKFPSLPESRHSAIADARAILMLLKKMARGK